MKALWIGVLIALSAGLLAGCYTPPDDAESDMPWNTPQPWEGTPYVPGYMMEQ